MRLPVFTLLALVGFSSTSTGVSQVTVQQQPRGSYTLEVFKGYLAVGGLTISNLTGKPLWKQNLPILTLPSTNSTLLLSGAVPIEFY